MLSVPGNKIVNEIADKSGNYFKQSGHFPQSAFIFEGFYDGCRFDVYFLITQKNYGFICKICWIYDVEEAMIPNLHCQREEKSYLTRLYRILKTGLPDCINCNCYRILFAGFQTWFICLVLQFCSSAVLQFAVSVLPQRHKET